MPPRALRVFSVTPGAPFLATLVDALLGGEFGPVAGLGSDPLALAAVTIFLPTRRAARALADIFLERAGGRATVLPRIKPIGDVDEEEHILAAAEESPADLLSLPLAVPRIERQLFLTRLAVAWARVSAAGGDAVPRPIPASPADAVRLANDLARLIDEMTTAGVGFDALTAVDAEDYAQFWQTTLSFLAIAGKAWPDYLAERGFADPVARRDRLIRAEADRLAARPPLAPVIAAGSTGSIPATGELLKAIAHLPNGAVLLPGLDRDLDDASWRAIAEEPAPSHPQFGLSQLLTAIGIGREDVVDLGSRKPGLAHRARLLSDAMRPATTTDGWQGNEVHPAADEGISLIQARTEQEEALAVAVALREAAETTATTAALITPDRNLARRVSVELRRWGIDIDDSAGEPLAGTPPAVFARLLVETVAAPDDPIKLLALLKHPLAAFGLSRGACRQGARALEGALFRGAKAGGRLIDLPAAVAAARQSLDAAGQPVPRARRRLAEWDWQAAETLAGRVSTILGAFEGVTANATAAGEIAAALVEAATQAATDDGGHDTGFASGEAAESLAALLAAIGDDPTGPLAMRIGDFPAFLGALMAGVSVRRGPPRYSRVHIFGTLEARLQPVDLVILGGLDEGVWPADAPTDPWLSRGMRQAIGLQPAERRIGLAAHDFTSAILAPTAILTRAEKRGGSPTVASRWLQRLAATLGEARMASLGGRGQRYLSWARQLDRIDPKAVRPVARPEPRPAVALRPRQLSVTQIETWIRDPYAIYAREILRIRPLEAIGAPPDAATRGTLVHGILAALVEQGIDPASGDAEARLLAVAREAFRPLEAFPDTHFLWWIRIEAIIRWFVRWERSRAGDLAERYAETAGSLTIDAPAGPFTLTGRADRIDRRADGRIDIYDFKTGTPPSAAQVLTGFAPQLGLEAAMARQGAFAPVPAGTEVAALGWLGVNNAGFRDVERSAVASGLTADDVAARSLSLFSALVAAYDNADQPYRSQERPMFERRYPGEYDHLARLDEWRLATIDEDE
ncbi:MAG: double-strand break repair protein AddB [Bauldia sp.]